MAVSFGVFAPLMHVPMMGDLSYFANGRGDGVIMLALAAVCAIVTVAVRPQILWIPSGLCAILLVLFLVRFDSIYTSIQSEMTQAELGMFRGLGEAMAASIQIQWGFGLLALGTVLMIVAAFIGTVNE